MIILYVKDHCPYCQKVLRFTEEAGLIIRQRNIADAKNAEELLEKGGIRQVPYLDDTGRNVRMYEIDDIIRYLRTEYCGSE